MERAVVLTQGGGQPQASPALGDLVAQYSTILASQVSMACVTCAFRGHSNNTSCVAEFVSLQLQTALWPSWLVSRHLKTSWLGR